MSVCLYVNKTLWYPYQNGTFNDCADGKDINHCVLLVGYTPDHYILKNSWGTSWGDNGYMHLARN